MILNMNIVSLMISSRLPIDDCIQAPDYEN